MHEPRSFHRKGPGHLRRLDQIGPSARLEQTRGQVVESRVGDVHDAAETTGERVVRSNLVGEHARALLRHRPAFDAVEEQGRRVRGEAREQGGGGGFLGPGDELGQGLPVGLGPEIVGEGFGPGDDEAVRPAAVNQVEWEVVLGESLLERLTALESGKPVARESHGRPAEFLGSALEQFDELSLGLFERGVRHVVDERDLDHRASAVAPAASRRAVTLRAKSVAAARGDHARDLTVSRPMSAPAISP